jgi:dihydropteroate synthase
MRLDFSGLNLAEPQVMAIVNVTDDSFYAGSRTLSEQAVIERVESAIAEGASILDVGGYSSRPGAKDISVEQEWQRVEMGLRCIRRVAPSAVVSVDTFRSEVAERALEGYGPLIINDISAGEIDNRIIDVVARHDVPYIAMHMRGTPQTMQQCVEYKSDITSEVCDYFCLRVELLQQRGVRQIILDPGFGFAKSLKQNYELLLGLDKLCALHLNDSKNPYASHKDRHECIGDGSLGLDTFRNIVNHPQLKGKPMILETPNELPGYAREIALLRQM